MSSFFGFVRLATCACLLVACAGPPPKSAADGLPDYGAEDANLLDDGFSGHLFETSFVPGRAGKDANFEDRVRRAEGIWLVKVDTVSREGGAKSQRYSLVLRPVAALMGELPHEPISLTLSAKNPSFGWLDRMGGAWVGKELLLFARRYREADDAVLHFHGEPNSPELREEIGQIRRAARAQK